MNARCLCVAVGLAALLGSCAGTRAKEPVDTLTLASTDEWVQSPTERLMWLEGELAPVASERVWSHRFFSERGHPVIEHAVLCDHDLLIVTRDPASGEGVLHLIDASQGVHRWELAIGTSPLAHAPSASGAYAVVLTADGFMQAVSRRTGARNPLSMKARLGAVVPTAPAAATDTTIFVSSLTDDRLHALSPVSGATGWHFGVRGRIAAGPLATPALPRNLIVVGTDQGQIVALPPRPYEGGRPESAAWTHDLLDEVSGPLSYAEIRREGRIIASIVVPSRDNGLYCLDATSGEPRWIHWAKKPFTTMAVACGEAVVARNPDGLQAFALESGKSLWAEDAEARRYDAALVGDAKRVIVTKEGELALVEASTGRLRERVAPKAFQSVLGSSSLNLLIGIAADGSIVAVR